MWMGVCKCGRGSPLHKHPWGVHGGGHDGGHGVGLGGRDRGLHSRGQDGGVHVWPCRYGLYHGKNRVCHRDVWVGPHNRV